MRGLRSALLGAMPLAVAVLFCACGGGSSGAAVAKADVARAPISDSAREDAKALAAAGDASAWRLFGVLGTGQGNLFFSPFSISEAMAMVYAGARGDTAAELEAGLGFAALKDRTHPAFNALDQSLAAAGGKGAFQLSIANAAWGQQGHHFEQAYLQVLAASYGSGVRLAEFIKAPESARKTINDWVADQTQKRIKDLLPEGSVDATTRLVLTNAIYFKADWAATFEPNVTSKRPFTLLSGAAVTMDMMSQQHSYPYVRSGDVEAVELPYVGGRISMVILLPAQGRFESVQAGLDAKRVSELLGGLKSTGMSLSLPKFSFTSEFSLADTLRQLGIKTAFQPDVADFSGIDGTHDLFIQGVYHKAFVKVDEKGTEAAAATGVVVGATSAPGLSVTIDRPFVFLIRDNETGATLFLGRVMDPTK